MVYRALNIGEPTHQSHMQVWRQTEDLVLGGHGRALTLSCALGLGSVDVEE